MNIIKSIILSIVVISFINAYLMTFPILTLRKKEYPPKYQIQRNNKIDMQKNKECAAYSTAFVLRHFGKSADGEALYQNFPSKTSSGTIYTKGIRTVLKSYGFKTKYYKGTIQSLKYEVSKGIPVIVFIKVHKNQSALHFVPVVGYDDENIYVSESLKELVNCDETGYNRKIPINEFKQLWDVKTLYMPFYSNTFVTVKNA